MKLACLRKWTHIVAMMIMGNVLLGGGGVGELAAFLKLFNPAKYYNMKGNEAFSNNDFRGAVTWYQQATDHEADDPKVLNNLANALHKIEQYDRAETSYLSAIDLAAPSDAKTVSDAHNLLLSQLHYNLGNHYLERSEYYKSIEAYKESLKLNDKDLQTKKNLELALDRFVSNPKSQQSQSAPQNEEPSRQSDNQTQTPKPNRPAPATNQDQEDTTRPSQKSKAPLEQGRDEKLSSSGNDALPQEPKNKHTPKDNQDSQELISRKRANEILESFEERHKNFKKLNSQTPAPRPAYRSKTW